MENLYCPVCGIELQPVYKGTVLKEKKSGKVTTLDGAAARPAEWLCVTCKKLFRIEVAGTIT